MDNITDALKALEAAEAALWKAVPKGTNICDSLEAVLAGDVEILREKIRDLLQPTPDGEHHYGVSFNVRLWVTASGRDEAQRSARRKLDRFLAGEKVEGFAADYVEEPIDIEVGDKVPEVWAVFSKANATWQIERIDTGEVWPTVNMAPADYRDAFRKARAEGLLESGDDKRRLEVS